MTVNLTGVTDVQKITVTLTDVTDTSSHVLPPADVSVNMLIGDTSKNKLVNSFDVRQTRLQVGVPVTSANFREDVKPDGSITSTDVGQVRSHWASLPPGAGLTEPVVHRPPSAGEPPGTDLQRRDPFQSLKMTADRAAEASVIDSS